MSLTLLCTMRACVRYTAVAPFQAGAGQVLGCWFSTACACSSTHLRCSLCTEVLWGLSGSRQQGIYTTQSSQFCCSIFGCLRTPCSWVLRCLNCSAAQCRNANVQAALCTVYWCCFGHTFPVAPLSLFPLPNQSGRGNVQRPGRHAQAAALSAGGGSSLRARYHDLQVQHKSTWYAERAVYE